MSKLKTPNEAYSAACRSMLVDVGSAAGLRYCTAVDAAAPLIVAAELRQLTDHIFSMSRRPMTTHELCADIAQSYLKRADELDPQGVTK